MTCPSQQMENGCTGQKISVPLNSFHPSRVQKKMLLLAFLQLSFHYAFSLSKKQEAFQHGNKNAVVELWKARLFVKNIRK
jgi:hypothetical protein